jgi:hypothetical protein
VLAPVHSTSPKDGTVPKEAFAIDLETDTVTCPQGKTARRSTSPGRIARDRFAQARSVSGLPSSREATASPARCAALLAERAAGYPNQAPRGSAPSRASGVIRSPRARPSQAHQAADRAAARAHRPPLQGAQEPLPRGPKISVPGRLDRRPGQPPPDRGRAAGPGGLGASRRSEHSPGATPGRRGERRPETLFFSALEQKRDAPSSAAGSLEVGGFCPEERPRKGSDVGGKEGLKVVVTRQVVERREVPFRDQRALRLRQARQVPPEGDR